MKRLLITTAIIAMPSLAVAADRPAGWQSMDCDPDFFIAVESELNPGEVLYWNNRTCKVAGGPSDAPADAEEVVYEEPKEEQESEGDI